MFTKALSIISALSFISLSASAQLQCGTDEMFNRLKAANPQIAAYEEQQNQYLYDRIMVHPFGDAQMRGTSGGPDMTTVYDIPVVFHIIHEYGADYVADSIIYNEVAYINHAYDRSNADSLGIIKPYTGNIPGTSIVYRGKANIRFHLATIDPSGNPTNGITRHYSYLAGNAGDEAKFDIWPTNRYINLWMIRRFSGSHTGAAAYAYYPSAGAANPYADGVIGLYDYLGHDNTYAHELGHVLNLAHTWGNTNSPEVACGDDDVDDTPPTRGHNPHNGGSNMDAFCLRDQAGPTSAIWDTTCSAGYSKHYSKTQAQALYSIDDSITINYPDTVNAQNIMDYTYCSKMFTYGQAVRMRAAMNSSLAGRSNLWSAGNLAITGALSPIPNLTPVADFSVSKNFICANTTGTNGTITLTNRSWRDTITGSAWTFDNGTSATSSAFSPTGIGFNKPGWNNITLTATTAAGTGTISRSNAVYAADPTAISPNNYYQEFNGGDVDMFPIFNYYDSSNYKWELYNSGFFDQSGIRFKNYEPRTAYSNNTVTETPGGLYADFYTRGFDLSGSEFSSRAILNFYTAGAYRVTSTAKMNDSLEVYYSTNCGSGWAKAGVIAKTAIATKYEPSEYVPGGMDDWKLQGITLPSLAKTSKTFFRFRYKPGVDNSAGSTTPGFGTGNNFYLDRINISSSTLGVNIAELAARGVTLAPNPTSGSATITIKGGNNTTAQVVVTDIAGKIVYSTETRLNSAATQVEIPAAKISVKGMYLVHITSADVTSTLKLVAY